MEPSGSGAKARRRRLAALAYVGLAIVIASFVAARFDRSYASVGFVGILLVIVGGVGLMLEAQRELHRRIDAADAPAQGLAPGQPPAPLSLPALAAVTTFDLSEQLARTRKGTATTIWTMGGMVVFLVGLSAWAVYVAIVRDEYGLLFVPGLLIPLAAFVGLALRTVHSRPTQMRVGPDSLEFDMDPPGTATYRWSDPMFAIKLQVISAAVNRAADEPRDGPTFRFLTGRATGVGSGTQVVTEIPQLAFGLILRQAEAHGIYPAERVAGFPGTVSEYRELTLSRATNPFGSPTAYSTPLA